MNWMEILWLVLLVGFLAMEATTVNVTTIWFALGALAAMVASMLGAKLWLQVVLFFAVSGLLLALLRPVLRKYFTPKLTKTNVDAVIGTTGLVTARIDNVQAQGQVKLGAMEWSARSSSGKPLEVGTLIKVDRVEGVKVYVTPTEVPANVK